LNTRHYLWRDARGGRRVMARAGAQAAAENPQGL